MQLLREAMTLCFPEELVNVLLAVFHQSNLHNTFVAEKCRGSDIAEVDVVGIYDSANRRRFFQGSHEDWK